MTTGTDQLIDDLSSNLLPTRRIPALRTIAFGVAALWALLFALAAHERGLRPGLLQSLFDGGCFSDAVMGLLLATIGGVTAGLSAAVPGREDLGSGARLLGLAGLVLALAGGVYAALATRGASGASAGSNLHCFFLALALGLLPGAALVGFLLKGWVARPALAAALALLGGFASGGLAVHLLCPISGGLHMLLGHVGPALVLPLLGFAPLAVLLRRFAR